MIWSDATLVTVVIVGKFGELGEPRWQHHFELSWPQFSGQPWCEYGRE